MSKPLPSWMHDPAPTQSKPLPEWMSDPPQASRGAPDFDYTSAPLFAAPTIAAARTLMPGTEERAATLGFANGGTMGFVDEIGGAVAALLPEALGGVPESSVKLGAAAMPTGAESPEEFQAKSELIEGMANTPTSYELTRDRIRAEQKQAKEQQGGAYMAGDIAGGVAGSIAGNILLPGGGAVARGAAEGAIGGLGNSEADLLNGDVSGAARDTVVGGLVGGAAGYVGNKVGGWVGRKLGATPEALEGLAQGRAVKAATGQNKRAIGKMIEAGELGLDTGTVERVGSDLLNEGVVTAGANSRDILRRAAQQKEAWGNTIGEALDYLDNATPEGMALDVGRLADEMEQALVVPNLTGTPGRRQTAAHLAEYIQTLREQPNSLSALDAFKRALDEDINYAKVDMPAASKALLRLRSMLNSAIESKADEVAQAVGEPDVAQLFREAKAVFSSMSIGERVAQNQVTSQASNRLIAPSDYAAGIGGAVMNAASGGAALPAMAAGAGMAAAHKLVRTRGNQVAAAVFHGLSGNGLLRAVAENASEMLGKFSGPIAAAIARGAGGNDEALSAVDYVLQQTDPEYRAMKEALAKEAQQ